MSDQKPTHGTFCWNELMTRDVAGAKEFYTALIGWEADDSSMTDMNYTVFKADGKEVGGMMEMPKEIPQEVPPNWMGYITVDDVDAAAAKVPELGGLVLHGPMDIPQVGRFITIQDSTGGVVSLITLASK